MEYKVDLPWTLEELNEQELVEGTKEISNAWTNADLDSNGYVTVKSCGTQGELDQILLPEVVSEMVIGDNGDVLLVPGLIKQETDILDDSEVVMAPIIGNEVEITNDDCEYFDPYISHSNHHVSISPLNGELYDRLIIDTDAQIKLEEVDDELADEELEEEEVDLQDNLTCQTCTLRLRNRAELKKHLKEIHGKSRGRKKRKYEPASTTATLVPYLPATQTYTCLSCDYVTRRRDKLDKHAQKHVLVEGFHPCGKKRQKVGTPPQRYRHKVEEYKCELCPYSCTVIKALKKHLKNHETGKDVQLKYSCKVCGKDRPSEGDAEKHMKKHRHGDKFLCDLCVFTSVQLKKIIQHRRMHTGEKPHLCPFCIYRSARRDNLRSHVRRMHKKENMYIDTFIQSDGAGEEA